MTDPQLDPQQAITHEAWELIILFSHLFTEAELDAMHDDDEALLKGFRRVVEEVQVVKCRHDTWKEMERKHWESARKTFGIKPPSERQHGEG